MKTLLLLLGGAAMLGLTILGVRREPAGGQEDDPAGDNPAEDDPAGEAPAEETLPAPVPARVTDTCRTMDPVALISASRVTFALADGRECTLAIPGENGLHLQIGDEGQLTARGETFISFEKPDGETVGAMYYIPARSEEDAQ